MKIHRDLDQLPAFQNTVLTIGFFDGVHVGHQQILKRVCTYAESVSGQSVLITFHPHPRLVLAPQANSDLKLITSLEEKALLLEQYGLDHLVVVPFTKEFSNQSPDHYIEHFLVEHFHPCCIIIGYDHRYGKKRAGDISYLRKFEQKHRFKVEEISKQEVENIAVSSTKVRQALNSGQILQATQLLGHRFGITGKVVMGKQIGTTIGFPTANIQIESTHKLVPPEGIYAVQVYHRQQRYGGMLYIGNRPTIDIDLAQTIEVNIFNFNQSIYNEMLRVEFIAYLRGDAKFDSLEELKQQLASDKQSALAALSLEQ